MNICVILCHCINAVALAGKRPAVVTAKTKLLTGDTTEDPTVATKPGAAFVFDPNKTNIVDK